MNPTTPSADRVLFGARLFTGAGGALATIGVLGLAAGVLVSDWVLIVAGVLAVGAGVFVLLAGLGLRQTLRQAGLRTAGARVDAAAAATVAAATEADPTDDTGPTGCPDDSVCAAGCSSACALADLRGH